MSRAKRLSNLRQMLEAHKDGAFLFEKKVLRKPCVANLSQAAQLVRLLKVTNGSLTDYFRPKHQQLFLQQIIL